jgi:hypothetical protein
LSQKTFQEAGYKTDKQVYSASWKVNCVTPNKVDGNVMETTIFQVDRLTISLTNEPGEENRTFLRQQIRAYNNIVSPHHLAARQPGAVQPLAVFLRDEVGQIIGGLAGIHFGIGWKLTISGLRSRGGGRGWAKKCCTLLKRKPFNVVVSGPSSKRLIFRRLISTANMDMTRSVNSMIIPPATPFTGCGKNWRREHKKESGSSCWLGRDMRPNLRLTKIKIPGDE